jgi:hypothetical protein
MAGATTITVTCPARVGDLFWFPGLHLHAPDGAPDTIRPWKVVWVGASPRYFLIEIAFDRPVPWILAPGEPIEWLGRIGPAERVRAA